MAGRRKGLCSDVDTLLAKGTVFAEPWRREKFSTPRQRLLFPSLHFGVGI